MPTACMKRSADSKITSGSECASGFQLRKNAYKSSGGRFTETSTGRGASTVVSHTGTETVGRWGNIPSTHTARRSTYGPSRSLNDDDGRHVNSCQPHEHCSKGGHWRGNTPCTHMARRRTYGPSPSLNENGERRVHCCQH